MRNRVRLLLIILCVMCAHALRAQVQHGDSCYQLSFNGGYAYNVTYGHYGNFDLGSYLPINRHFEMEVDSRLSTANFYTLGAQLRPKFILPVGELYIETRALYRAMVRNRIHEISGGVGLGYRMQYVNVMLGCGLRIMRDMDLTYHSTEGYVLEPFNVLYKLEVFVRPQTCNWNLVMCVSNMDAYQIERQWQPLFMLGGYYDINSHWRVRLASECKPTGMFHLNAAFYGIDVRTGFEYRF